MSSIIVNDYLRQKTHFAIKFKPPHDLVSRKVRKLLTVVEGMTEITMLINKNER